MQQHKILKYYIEKSGYTKKDISEAIGVSAATVSNWCSGKAFPSARHANALSEILKVDKDILTGKKPAPLPETYEEFSRLLALNGISLLDVLMLADGKEETLENITDRYG